MNTWIIPNNPKDYDVRKGLAEYGSEIEWTKSLASTNIAAGDDVYIYVSAPIKALTMKFTVTDQNVTIPVQRHRDSGVETGSSWFKIRFLQNIEPIAYATLLSAGVVNGYIQAARLLKTHQESILTQYIVAKDSNERVPQNSTNTTPALYSKEGCVFCDELTQGRQYQGKLREYRTMDGRTMPWTDASSGIRLTRTIDFFAGTGETFRGSEIAHNQRVHDAVTGSRNLIAFTVASSGMKRYVLTQDDDGVRAAIMRKLQSAQHIETDELAEDINSIDNLDDIEEVLAVLATTLPPLRVEQVVYRVARNPKIAQLVKEKQRYICEICGRPPFIQKNGKPYAEADHIRPLGGASRGLDTPENIRCICAQCHAVVTHGSAEIVRELLGSGKWQS